MFTPSPRSKEPFNQRESRASSESEKFTTKLSIPLESSAVTRGRRRASVGAAAKSSVASSDQVTTFSIEQTTPLQLEAVGLLRKPTPQSARSQTPPHKSLPSTVTTPLSSRNRGRTGKIFLYIIRIHRIIFYQFLLTKALRIRLIMARTLKRNQVHLKESKR